MDCGRSNMGGKKNEMKVEGDSKRGDKKREQSMGGF